MNLGLIYGMGQKKLGSELGLGEDDTKELFEKYHARVPFVKQLMGLASKTANDNGQVRTILGRLCHFDLWEPTKWGVHKALPRDEAMRKYGSNLKRAFIYKALNVSIVDDAMRDKIKYIMENCVELEVPSRVDPKEGKSWGTIKK